MMCYRSTVIFLFLFILTSSVFSQGQSDLDRVRREIEQLENEIRSKEAREKSLVEQVEDVDREVGLKRKLLKALETEKNRTQRNIRSTQRQLQKTTKDYNRLKSVVAQRMVQTYMRGRTAEWEVIFSLTSINQAMVWLKYQRRIVDNDKRNLELLHEKEVEIRDQNTQLQNVLQKKNRLINEETEETEVLENTKQKRERLLIAVRQDKQSLQERLERTRQAYEQIRGQIRKAEERRRAEATVSDGGEFASLKGKMTWPAKGKVVTKHGRRMNSELRVWEENLGIDIEAAESAMVKCVASGSVIVVQWIRGKGNVVIVDHGGGYYTVYGHLDVAVVNSGEAIQSGDPVGLVGDRKGLNGSTVHFEIWKGEDHFNPEAWLLRGGG